MRRHILRAFAGHGLRESLEAKEMLAHQHRGFSADASASIEAQDRAALEHLRAATLARRLSLCWTVFWVTDMPKQSLAEGAVRCGFYRVLQRFEGRSKVRYLASRG